MLYKTTLVKTKVVFCCYPFYSQVYILERFYNLKNDRVIDIG